MSLFPQEQKPLPEVLQGYGKVHKIHKKEHLC